MVAIAAALVLWGVKRRRRQQQQQVLLPSYSLGKPSDGAAGDSLQLRVPEGLDDMAAADSAMEVYTKGLRSARSQGGRQRWVGVSVWCLREQGQPRGGRW